jgi:ATP-dependent helicase/nuclease subunit A
MRKSTAISMPPDQPERERALDPVRSILVEAPAGSGKTDLLTRRFLRLLAEVEEPSQIVAITFTKAAAAEMRHRILSELEKAALVTAPALPFDEFSMEALALRALGRSHTLDWQLPDLPARLRISTIDSFCRELAIQQPLLSGVGGELKISDEPRELYRRAARHALEQVGGANSGLSSAIEQLLLWRDNTWQEMEDLLIEMLGQRDRWMHGFLLEREPDWEGLRNRLERPFADSVRDAVTVLDQLLDQVPGAKEEAMALARFVCTETGGELQRDLAELSEFPSTPFLGSEALEEARAAFSCLALLLLTKQGAFRKRVYKSNGFHVDRKAEKSRLIRLIRDLKTVEGFKDALAGVSELPPARYTEEDWQIVRDCFTLLRHAAGELRTVFAEADTVDFIEVAQLAERVLRGDDGFPSDAAMAIADGIRHLLVDEFQDTNRRQHQLIASLAAAWPEPTGRTIFVVGDPMQSIYSFRDADAELFPRLRDSGLDIPDGLPFLLDHVALTSNFRTEPALVEQLNNAFTKVFEKDDGSGISFSAAEPAREPVAGSNPLLKLHLQFSPQTKTIRPLEGDRFQQSQLATAQRGTAREAQTAEVLALIRRLMNRVERARARGEKYRIAVLGRTRNSLAPIASALREAGIPFRAIDLEPLKGRQEVLDVLALGRALLNPMDRVAWLGILRAPWCGLSLADLHTLANDENAQPLNRPIPELIAERHLLLGSDSRLAVERVLKATASAPQLRNALPTSTFGTRLQQTWLRLGGASCVDSTARANLDLLWSCLDRLRGGEQDFLGPALDSALEKLTALPNPEAASECGLQLMTIHKSKGLEFEVVIVPELQAQGGRTRVKLLSWLERGLPQPDGTGDLTEFLVAPVPSKGTDRSKTRVWVDSVCRRREVQEIRRILYVAATRAREQLHFFARPEFKQDAEDKTLVEPKNCLLAAAWPAFEEDVRARFDEWKSTWESSQSMPETNLKILPSPAKPTLLSRLPPDEHSAAVGSSRDSEVQPFLGIGDGQLYSRHEGGARSRALGTAVHRLLEELARLASAKDWSDASAVLSPLLPGIEAKVRGAGFSPAEATSIAHQAFEIALQATKDPNGRWILKPRTGAASEASWTGVVGGAIRSVRVDRVFRSGLAPLSEGEAAWWIVDYKTAHANDLDASVGLPFLRKLFAPQLEAYAEVLRKLPGGSAPIRAGLYYPRMSLFDWWEIES